MNRTLRRAPWKIASTKSRSSAILRVIIEFRCFQQPHLGLVGLWMMLDQAHGQRPRIPRIYTWKALLELPRRIKMAQDKVVVGCHNCPTFLTKSPGLD